MSEKITLSNEIEVTIHHIPAGLRDVINARYPSPEPPITETVTATGGTIRMMMEDDPDYLAEVARVQVERDTAWQQAYTLAALREVKVPEDFDIETVWGEMLRWLNPDWKPREGKVGRKLDYIEFDLLENIADQDLITTTINHMMGIDEEVVERIEASFRSEVAGEAN